ncbi:MAG: hypothetical protein ACI95S_001247, partial [Dinoroseobacter sp.]
LGFLKGPHPPSAQSSPFRSVPLPNNTSALLTFLYLIAIESQLGRNIMPETDPFGATNAKLKEYGNGWWI